MKSTTTPSETTESRSTPEPSDTDTSDKVQHIGRPRPRQTLQSREGIHPPAATTTTRTTSTPCTKNATSRFALTGENTSIWIRYTRRFCLPPLCQGDPQPGTFRSPQTRWRPTTTTSNNFHLHNRNQRPQRPREPQPHPPTKMRSPAKTGTRWYPP